jgi:hypothetical protein
LGFEENRGQTDSRVRFLSHGQGYRVFVTTTETVLVAAGNPSPTVLTMKLIGANPGAPSAGFDKLPGKVNYFVGNDPAKWRTRIPHYSRIEYKSVYGGWIWSTTAIRRSWSTT